MQLYETILNWSTNGLTAFGCIMIFYSGCRSSRRSDLALKLILLLSLADFAQAIINFVSYAILDSGSTACNIIGPLRVFTAWIGLFCTSRISLLAYLTLGNYRRFNLKKIF